MLTHVVQAGCLWGQAVSTQQMEKPPPRTGPAAQGLTPRAFWRLRGRLAKPGSSSHSHLPLLCLSPDHLRTCPHVHRGRMGVPGQPLPSTQLEAVLWAQWGPVPPEIWTLSLPDSEAPGKTRLQSLPGVGSGDPVGPGLANRSCGKDSPSTRSPSPKEPQSAARWPEEQGRA